MHNTAVHKSTGQTHYEILFGTNPQTHLSLKSGLIRDNQKKCTSEFCSNLPPLSNSEKFVNQEIKKLLQNRLSSEMLKQQSKTESLYLNINCLQCLYIMLRNDEQSKRL